MENYTKGRNEEEEIERGRIPIPGLPDNFLWMQVKGGSKMKNLLSHAAGAVEDGTQIVIWSGAGAGLPKAVSCAEIFKRDFELKHQITKICYKTDKEYWEPKIEGLETIVVNREIPVIHICLSLVPLNSSSVGYQNLTEKPFWQGNNKSENKKVKSQPYNNRTKKSAPKKHKNERNHAIF